MYSHLDRSQSVFYFVPQENTVKQTRLLPSVSDGQSSHGLLLLLQYISMLSQDDTG